jgi:MFS family permease
MWNAITSMAGGLDDARVASAATAVLYLAYGVASLIAPSVTSVIGPRVTLAVGALGYAFYVASLLLYQRGLAGGGVVIVGGAINGVGGGMMWVAQALLLYSYCGPNERAAMYARFFLVCSLGSVAGGIIELVTNFDSNASAASAGTYATFIAVMLCGACCTGLLLPPARVVRPDGSFPPPAEPLVAWMELSRTFKLGCRKQVLALAPLCFLGNFFYAYQFTCFNARLFNARTQGLNNTAFWAVEAAASIGMGRLLDSPRCGSTRRRGMIVLAVTAAAVGLSWASAIWANTHYELDRGGSGDSIDALRAPADWAVPFLVYIVFAFVDALLQLFIFWLIGQLGDNPQYLSRANGFLRSVQCIGNVTAWVLSTYSWGCDGKCAGDFPPSAQAYLNVALVAAALPPTAWFVFTQLGDGTHSSESRIGLAADEETPE